MPDGSEPAVSLWDVHVTIRDERGYRQDEFCGTHPLASLPGVLERAMRRASERAGGVQVILCRPLDEIPGSPGRLR